MTDLPDFVANRADIAYTRFVNGCSHPEQPKTQETPRLLRLGIVRVREP